MKKHKRGIITNWILKTAFFGVLTAIAGSMIGYGVIEDIDALANAGLYSFGAVLLLQIGLGMYESFRQGRKNG